MDPLMHLMGWLSDCRDLGTCWVLFGGVCRDWVRRSLTMVQVIIVMKEWWMVIVCCCAQVFLSGTQWFIELLFIILCEGSFTTVLYRLITRTGNQRNFSRRQWCECDHKTAIISTLMQDNHGDRRANSGKGKCVEPTIPSYVFNLLTEASRAQEGWC